MSRSRAAVSAERDSSHTVTALGGTEPATIASTSSAAPKSAKTATSAPVGAVGASCPSPHQVLADGPHAERGQPVPARRGRLDQPAVAQQRERALQLGGQAGGQLPHLRRAGLAGHLVRLEDALDQGGVGEPLVHGVHRREHLGEVLVHHGGPGQALVGAVQDVHDHAVPELQERRGGQLGGEGQRPGRGDAPGDPQHAGVDRDDPEQVEPVRAGEPELGGGPDGVGQQALGGHLAGAGPRHQPLDVGHQRDPRHGAGEIGVGGQVDRGEAQRLAVASGAVAVAVTGDGVVENGRARLGRRDPQLVDQPPQRTEIEDVAGVPALCHP
ncbi:hypothetical protein [Planobispora longispora]|uniref:hypothetical protein n=1 Tax=Planobispora longispora TaxID=28887 RepID=UPI003608AA61